MPKTERLSNAIEWIEASFVERERTPRRAVELGFRCHLSGMSLRDTSKFLVSKESISVSLLPTTNRVTTRWFLDDLHQQCRLRAAKTETIELEM